MLVVSPNSEGICVPDTVVLAQTAPPGHRKNDNGLPAPGGDDDRPASPTTHTPPCAAKTTHPGNTTQDKMNSNNSARKPLLWAFSTPESTMTKGDSGSSRAHGGVLEGSTTPRLSGVGRAPQRRIDSIGESHLSPVMKQEHRLQTEEVTGEDGLLRAARGICECARRRGGGRCRGGGNKLALPLALLKIWGHGDDVGGKAGHLLGGNDKRRRRRLLVVSWTLSRNFAGCSGLHVL